jgi:hypothetical protein
MLRLKTIERERTEQVYTIIRIFQIPKPLPFLSFHPYKTIQVSKHEIYYKIMPKHQCLLDALCITRLY